MKKLATLLLTVLATPSIPAPAHATTSLILLDMLASERERARALHEDNCIALDTAHARAAGNAEEAIRIERIMISEDCARIVGPARASARFEETCDGMRARLDNAAADGVRDDALAGRYKTTCIDVAPR